jgi:hypothetical protein
MEGQEEDLYCMMYWVSDCRQEMRPDGPEQWKSIEGAAVIESTPRMCIWLRDWELRLTGHRGFETKV